MQAFYCYTPALIIMDKDYRTQKFIGARPASFTEMVRGYQEVQSLEEIPAGAVLDL